MRRRRKPVMWAAMRFLLEAYKQQRRRLKFEQFLLLAARCLLVALIGLAIARPLLGRAGVLGGRGSVTLYLLIDNGLASSAQPTGEKDALSRHKTSALALLSQLDPAAGDRAAILAMGGPAQPLVVPPSANLSGLRETIEGLTPTDSATDIPGALAAVRAALDASAASDAGRTVVALLSDYAAGSADTERKLTELAGPDARGELVVLSSRPAETGAANISISGLEPLQPVVLAPGSGQSVQSPVRVSLRRSGESAAAATTVRFAVQGQGRPTPAGQAVVRWTPGQTEVSTTAAVDFGAAGAGSLLLTASIDADAIAGDNLWRRPVEMRRSLRVGVVTPRRTATAKAGIQQYEPADWFRLALQPVDPAAAHAETEIDVVEIEPSALDAGRLAGLDAAILPRPDAIPEGAWRRLRTFTDAGGLVLVSAPPQATVHLWADPMIRDLGLTWSAAREARAYPQGAAIAADESAVRGMLAMLAPELQELAAPVKVQRILPVEAGARGAALLRLNDGTPLVLAAIPGAEGPAVHRGMAILLAVAPAFDWTDLQSKPIMVALTQELIRQGVGRARGTASEIAGATPEVPPRAVELRPVAEGGTVLRAAAGRASEPMRRAGAWRAVDETGASRGMLVVNADAAAGRTDPQPAPGIAAWLRGAAGSRDVHWLGGSEAIASGVAPGQEIRAALKNGEDPGRLALPLLIGALALAAAELVLARLFSHAVVQTGAAA